MATVLSRQIITPTILLYSFVVITQFAYGFYAGWHIEAPPGYTLLHWVAQLWIIGWWLRSDIRRRNAAWVYDMGFFLCIGWPIVMPYYLLKTRGAKGLLYPWVLLFSVVTNSAGGIDDDGRRRYSGVWAAWRSRRLDSSEVQQNEVEREGWVMVDSIAASLQQIENAGGKVVTPRTDIGPNMGAFAVFTDPVGNEFGLYQEPRR